MKLPKIPQLDNDARDELPAGDVKMSTQRGTLAHWVISTLTLGFSALLWIVHSNYKSQLEKCELKNIQYEKILIPQIQYLEKQVERTEVIIEKRIDNIDSIIVK